MGVLENDGFMADGKLQGNGDNYHIVSVFLEDLKEVGFPVRNKVVDVIFGPFFGVLKKSDDRILVGKVASCVFDELLKMGWELLGKKKMGWNARSYEVGSSVECFQENKKVVFGLHEEFLKLEKDLESCGYEIVVPKYNEAFDGSGDDEEVPQLIAIDNNTSDGECASTAAKKAENVHDDKNESDDESLKKSKRAKKCWMWRCRSNSGSGRITESVTQFTLARWREHD
ncbi:ribosomal RNA proCES [Forsythia ovata]|uniref:Ribosomal RNA proCES n=1 Tax=Forsythia ovata TaxID=205694 RepID=A0ABD1X7S1_9LAMI